MKTVVFLPTQGPHMPRRGPAELFDWREQCRMAAAISRADSLAMVYVPSAFQQAGSRSELEFYGDQLLADGVPAEALQLEAKGLDTVEQCELALAVAARENARLTVISCAVQVRRVTYLMRGRNVEIQVAHGTPNRWLRFTHVVLGIVFPVLDVLGLKQWWLRFVARRRLAGKQ